jgi:hypothetical protein
MAADVLAIGRRHLAHLSVTTRRTRSSRRGWSHDVGAAPFTAAPARPRLRWRCPRLMMTDESARGRAAAGRRAGRGCARSGIDPLSRRRLRLVGGSRWPAGQLRELVDEAPGAPLDFGEMASVHSPTSAEAAGGAVLKCRSRSALS